MASLPAFGSPSSGLEKLQRRFNAPLCRYWRISRALYAILILGAAVPGLTQWFFQSVVEKGQTKVPDLRHYRPFQLLTAIPWLTALVLIAIIASVVIANRANRNRPYYQLLDASVKSYQRARRGYRGIAAQLQDTRRAGSAQAFRDSPAPDVSLTVFDENLYTERSHAVKIYSDFLNQSKHRIFLVVGRGGSGKSTFLLHRMGELSGSLATKMPFHPHPSVFIDCKLDHLTDANDLATAIRNKLGKGLPDIITEGIRDKPRRALVVFVDAINENVSPAGQDVNVHLTQFAQEYLNGQYTIYLCVSVRTAYWKEQRHRFANNPTSSDLAWLDYVYLPERQAHQASSPERGAETATVLLEDFDQHEFDNAYRSYQQVYHITGTIPDERTRRICGNPLMLQVFCITFQGQDIRDLDIVRNLVRDLDIFDAYARGALARASEQVGIRAAEPIRRGETLAQRAIRGFLLEIALGMVDRGRQFLSDDEVFSIAQTRAREALTIAGQRINSVDGLYRDGSVLKAILDEGIVLESDRGLSSGGNQGSGIRFVTERYLEYSIGRGLVRRWRLAGLGRDQINADFRRQMERHVQLREQGFDNLRQGLGIVVLTAEQPESELFRGIQWDLLNILAHDPDFDWNQLACRAVQQLKTFNRARPIDSEQHNLEVEVSLSILDELAKKNDFVLRWDIERALLHSVEAGEAHAVLRHLQAWIEPAATFSQRLFSGESLGYLFRQQADYRREVAGALRHIIDTASELDFWILRSLMFSIAAMTDTLDGIAAPTGEDTLLREALELLPQALLKFCRRWWDQSVVLSGQIERDAAHARLARWRTWQWDAESAWVRVNAALATEQACKGGCCSAETVEFLRQLRRAETGFNPYLSWAVWHVLGRAVECADTGEAARMAAVALREELEHEARGVLDQDSRAAWIVQAALPDHQAGPPHISTPIALVYHPEYGHTDLHNHPESKERVQAILDRLEVDDLCGGRGWHELLTYVSPYRFRHWDDQLLRLAHPREWIRRVQQLSAQLAEEEKSHIVLESDLEVRAGSYEGAVLAARGAVCAVDLVISDPSVRLAVALVRPPGHLAGNKICIFNNIAIAARYGQQVLAGHARDGKGKPRVLIVDCDAHHGKSTQDIFYADDSVFYFSTHQAGVHPGTGRFSERGRHAGGGYTVNVPIPALSGDRVYAEVLRRILEPVLDGFRPELILVSMGLDAYYRDDFSQLELSEWSFCQLASTLLGYCKQNPGVGVVATLEGGYDIISMGQCVMQFMSIFGEWAPAVETPKQRSGTSLLDRYLLMEEHDALAPGTAGPHVPSLAASDQQWLADLTALEKDLHRQWAR